MWKKCCTISCIKCSDHHHHHHSQPKLNQKNTSKSKTIKHPSTNSEHSRSLLLVNSSNTKHAENNYNVNSKCDHLTTSMTTSRDYQVETQNMVDDSDRRSMMTTVTTTHTTTTTGVATISTPTSINSITTSDLSKITLYQPGSNGKYSQHSSQINPMNKNTVNITTTSAITADTNDRNNGDTHGSKDNSLAPLMLSTITSSSVIMRPGKQLESFVHRIEKDEEGTRPFNQLFRRSVSNIHFTTNNHAYSHCNHHNSPTFFLPRTSTDPNTSTSNGLYSITNNSFESQLMNKKIPIRRGSMIVRLGRSSTGGATVATSTSSPSTNGITGVLPDSSVEGVIVTPFAQVLVSMQRIRNAFIRLTAAQVSNRYNITTVFDSVPTGSLAPDSSDYKIIANETLEELEWCLKQLENIQTKRPVSDMAFSKFKRLLNKELNSFGEADKSRHQISAYICETFLETEKDVETNEEIDSMLERRRSSGQSHNSTSGQDTNTTSKRQSSGTCDPNANVTNTRTPDTSSSFSSSVIKTRLGSTGSMSTESRKSAQLNDSSGLLTTKLSSSSKSTSQNVDDGNGPYLPIHGVETPNDNELEERFSQCLDEWGLDIFEIDRLSNGHALTTVAYRIFQKRDLLKTFCIDPRVFVRYLLRVESTYHADVPYHNSMHAADVLQTAHFLLQAEALDDVFSDLEILAVLFAAAIHDVDHPGVTNQFLINTGHELALQYNDASVLENHHLYMAFKILTEKDCDIFANLGGKKRQTLRRMVIELVLATDMSKHMSLLADLRTMVETKKVSGSGMLNLDNYADRIQILQNMIHCADLSNPAKPLRLYRKWTGRLIEEFFRQGDKERKLSLEISPMCDRESVEVEKSQVSFIDFVCHPLWETWCDLVHPCAQLILDTLEDNRDWYECHIKESKIKVTQLARPKLATAAEDDEEISTTSGNT
ncbi:unnamed protein product [Schistosoma intercalatum]|nr:unnamed protein product [Schistosoma intercalatum]CAH8617298.1 unnamed protein product [Schistosoma intercalatum]